MKAFRVGTGMLLLSLLISPPMARGQTISASRFGFVPSHDDATMEGGSSSKQSTRADTIAAAVLGAGAGAGIGYFLWSREHDCRECGPSPARFVIAGAAVGALVGAALANGLSRKYPNLRSQLPLEPKRPSVVPVIARTRGGTTLGIQFSASVP